MPNETTGDAPLSASIGAQLEEKRVEDQQASAAKEAAATDEGRIERRKAEERAEVAKHLGEGGATPEGWRARREAARARGRTLAWLRDNATVLALPVAAAGGLVLGLLAGPRKKGFPIAGALVAGTLWWRRQRLAAG